MDGKRLVHALCAASGRELRTIYVLACDLGMAEWLLLKVKNVFSRDSDAFARKLAEKADALEEQSDASLRLGLLLELAKHYEVKTSDLSTEQELERLAGEIVEAAYSRMAKETEFFAYVNKHPGASRLLQMTDYHLSKLQDRMEQEVQADSDEKQDELADKLEQYIQTMPEEQREMMRKQLGVEPSPDSSAVAGTAPVFPLLGDKIMPMVIVQLVLPSISRPQLETNVSQLLAEWDAVVGQYREINEEIRLNREEAGRCEAEIKRCRNEIDKLKALIKLNDKRIEEILREIEAELSRTDLNKLPNISDEFTAYLMQYAATVRHIEALRLEQGKQEEGVLGWLSHKVQFVSRQKDIAGIERKQKELLDKLCREIIDRDCGWGNVWREETAGLRADNIHHQESCQRLETLCSEWEKELKQRKHKLSQLAQHRKKLEKTYYGLSD